MRIAYFDCLAGASGDMILGALVDAGVAIEALREDLSALNLMSFELATRHVLKNGIRALKVDVLVTDPVAERKLPEIIGVIEASGLPTNIKGQAISIFHHLGEVEAVIHGTSLEEIHLHELGGLDTIVDVTGALIGLEKLGVKMVYTSPLPLGRGMARGAHGSFPLPAPATLALLEGVPVVGSELDTELVTPTGAAILAGLTESFGPIPEMRLQQAGYGAGERELPVPNVLRVILGELDSPSGLQVEDLVMLESNIDDLNPEIYEHVTARLFAAGALDVILAPVQMKKNRPGTSLGVLCHLEDSEALRGILFAETTTLGVREHTVRRYALERQAITVQTPYGDVRVKVAKWGEDRQKASPEYEDCRKLAHEKSVPLLEVFQAAQEAARQQLGPS